VSHFLLCADSQHSFLLLNYWCHI